MDFKKFSLINGLLRPGAEKLIVVAPDRYFLFLLNDAVFSLRSNLVRGIASILDVVNFANMPAYIRGMVKFEKLTIPVFDMRIMDKNGAYTGEAEPVILIIDLGESMAGLIVDRILDVVTIRDEHADLLRARGKERAAGREPGDAPAVMNAWRLLADMEKILKGSDLGSLSEIQ